VRTGKEEFGIGARKKSNKSRGIKGTSQLPAFCVQRREINIRLDSKPSAVLTRWSETQRWVPFG